MYYKLQPMPLAGVALASDTSASEASGWKKKRKVKKDDEKRKGWAIANRSRGRYILGKPRAKLRWVKWRPLARATKGGQVQVQVQLGLARCSFQGRAAENATEVRVGGGQRFVSGQDMPPQPLLLCR